MRVIMPECQAPFHPASEKSCGGLGKYKRSRKLLGHGGKKVN